MKHTVYLGLGSNVGNRIDFLAAAVRGIADFEMTVVDAVSDVYQTEPVGNVQQDEFLNLAVSVRTDLSVEQFHAKIKWLETQIGRTESEKWGPREIDIDLLFFDLLVLHTEKITVPHGEVTKRKFVLQPLSELAPMLMHPVLHRSIEELNNETTDSHGVEYSENHTAQLYALINDSITNPTV